MSERAREEDGDPQSRVCNVCHLPYTGDECPACKAEREHTLAVIQERGRRHYKNRADENQGPK